MKSEKIEMSLEAYPAFVAARDKLAEVSAQRHAAQAEVARLLADLNGAASRQETLADAAQRVLEGGAEPPAPDSLRGQYGAALRRAGLLVEVERLARQRVEEARAVASREICEQARPQFSRLVEAELKAAHALLTAQQARKDFWQDMSAAGLSMATMPSVSPVLKGDLRDPTGIFWVRTADAERLGYIAPDTFPRPVRKPGPADPLHRPGLRLLSAGPAGVGAVEVLADGRTRPVQGEWCPTPKAAPAWGDAA